MNLHFSAYVSKIKALLLPLSTIALISVGCSSEGKISKNVKAGKLLIESGSENPQDNDAYFEPGQKLSPIQAFQLTSHSFLQQKCGAAGLGCHATENSPFFASDDINVAFEAAFTGNKIDPLNIDRSVLILRLDPENHYCWTPDCSDAAAEMKLKIQDWISEITDGTIEKMQADAVRFSSSESFTLADLTLEKNPTLPDEFQTILVEAESGTLSGSAALETDPLGVASSGKFVTLGPDSVVDFTFDVTEAGDYVMFGLSSSLDDATNSARVALDGGGAANWNGAITPSLKEYAWKESNLNPTTLAVGSHTLKVTGNEEGLKFDGFAITTNTEFKGTEIRTSILKFDLAKIQEVDLQATGTLEVEIKVYDDKSYVLKNLAVWLDSGSVNVRGVKILMNGIWDPRNATYMAIGNTGEKTGEVVTAPGRYLSTSSMLMAIENLGEDSFSLQFEEIK